MTRVILNVTTTYNGHPLKIGDSIDVQDKIAKRWLNRGIATKAGEVILEDILPDPKPDRISKTVKKIIADNKVSIVILVKDALDYFRRCLASVVMYSVNYELIIIDNGSNSKTKKFLSDTQAKYGFRLVTNEKNMGFAYGCNQGIKLSTCDYVCFLNSDTVVTKGWLAKLLKGLELKGAGAVGPSSCWVSGKQMLRQYAQKRFKMTDDEIQKVQAPQGYEEFVYPDYLIGFCVLVKREVLDVIGGFDYEAFPLALGEDVDFTLRIQKAGYKTYWIKDCYIHHFGSQTILELGINWQKLSKENKPALIEKKEKIKAGEVYFDNKAKAKVTKKKLNKTNVIIPVLDRPEQTTKTLKELFKNNKDIRVIIIDNGSDDLEYLSEFDVEIIKNKKNLCVSKSYNKGLNIADSKYVVLMHNDILVQTKDWINIAIDFMEQNAYVGAVGQAGWTSLNYDATRVNEQNPVGWWIGSLKTTIERYKVKPNGFEEVAILDGCCNVVRNNGIRLDENLPYYFYDYDIAIQYRDLGYKVYVMGGSSIHFADDRKIATINLDKCKKSKEEEKEAHNKSRKYLLEKWKGVIPLSV